MASKASASRTAADADGHASAVVPHGEAHIHVLECHDCGLRLRAAEPTTPAAETICPRCGHRLFGHSDGSLDRVLAATIAALILFFLANTFPFLTFAMEGNSRTIVLISGVIEFLDLGMLSLAILVASVVVIVPLLKILGTLYVVVPLRLGFVPPRAAEVFRLVQLMRPWAMLEVYLLGVMVAYVKLTDFAQIELGVALFSLIGLILITVYADAALEPHDIWKRLPIHRPDADPADAVPVEENTDPATANSAQLQSAIACRTCHLMCRPPATASRRAYCPRCGDVLHGRKPNSTNRAWAWLITAFILYIPANVFPVMTVISFGRGAPDTILSGVEELIGAGMWPLALVVFFASITVPMLKMIGLAWLLIMVHRRSNFRLRERTRLYRIVEAVGRWSMIDVFMISILIALVQLGSIATIEPGVGAIAFAGVVVTTMIAASCFDPRITWDAAAQNHGN